MQYIFGTGDMAYVVAGIIFITTGALLQAVRRGMHGAKNNPYTPNKFQWRILLGDKWAELLSGWVLAGICVRFAAEFGISEFIRVEGTLALCFVLGFFNYMLSNWLMKKAPGGGK